ncbi:alpha/beta hydrolase [Frankia canadensis]|uniref:alpha/beta hydrolase n=1 Tax=Frankia canadensis TaxID=1836972 RepID=UPI000C7B3217|nr:alpha/beta hydrolase [Frankia canadensis]
MSTSAPLDFPPPQGLRERGTVVVVPGRGESAATYRRLGARLAADAYRIRVLPAPPALPAQTLSGTPGSGPAGILGPLADALSAAVTGIGDGPARPLVLVGADSGAAALAALVATAPPDAAWWPDAVVLAGLPGHGSRLAADDWAQELDARTHCPVHRETLADDPATRPGMLADALPDTLLDLAYGSTAPVPALLLTGDTDPLADRDALRRLAKSLPVARLAVVRGGHRDVLNDLQHRSVAAEVVGFLEALRAAPPLVPSITVESSAW